MKKLTLWRDQRATLEAAGLEEDAIEAIRCLTAPARHDERVQAAIEAALNAGSALEMARAILNADRVGVGGRCDASGAATARIPALEGLGSGRKQARDGGAWDAAILGAVRELERAGAPALEAAQFAAATDDTIPPRWRRAVGLRVMAAIIEGCRYVSGAGDAIDFDGDIAAWGAILAEAEEALKPPPSDAEFERLALAAIDAAKAVARTDGEAHVMICAALIGVVPDELEGVSKAILVRALRISRRDCYLESEVLDDFGPREVARCSGLDDEDRRELARAILARLDDGEIHLAGIPDAEFDGECESIRVTVEGGSMDAWRAMARGPRQQARAERRGLA